MLTLFTPICTSDTNLILLICCSLVRTSLIANAAIKVGMSASFVTPSTFCDGTTASFTGELTWQTDSIARGEPIRTMLNTTILEKISLREQELLVLSYVHFFVGRLRT